MSPEEKIRRGLEAKRLMAEPLLVEAFELLEDGINDAFGGTGLGADALLRLHLMKGLAKKLPVVLQGIISDGELSAANLVVVKGRAA